MIFLLRHELIYWSRWLGQFLKRALLAFFVWSVLFLGATALCTADPNLSRSSLVPAFLCGLGLSFVLYALGHAIFNDLFDGANTNLFPRMPMTPAHLIGYNIKASLSLLIPAALVLMIGPYLYLQSKTQPIPQGLLVYVNVALTMLALMLYPSVLKLVPRSGFWDVFFLCRRLIRDFAGRTANPYMMKLIMCVAIAVVIGARFLRDSVFADFLWRLIHAGVSGRVAIFIFSPFSGLACLSASDMPVRVGLTLAICLAAANFAMVCAISRVFFIDMSAFEKERHAQWLNLRDSSEEWNEVFATQQYEHIERPFQQRSAALARKDAPAPENPLCEPLESADDPADENPFADEAVFPNYDPAMNSLDLIEREQRSWDQIRFGEMKPAAPASMWRRAIPQFLIFVFVLVFGTGVVQAHPEGGSLSGLALMLNMLAAGMVAFFLPLFVLLRQAACARGLVMYSHLAPMRWRDVLSRMNHIGGRTLIFLNLAGGVVLGRVLGGSLFHIIAAVATVIMMQRVSCSLYWLEARRMAGRTKSFRAASLVWLCAVVINFFLIFMPFIPPSNEFLFGTALLLVFSNILLILCTMIVGFAKTRDHLSHFDDQVALAPGRLPKPIISL